MPQNPLFAVKAQPERLSITLDLASEQGDDGVVIHWEILSKRGSSLDKGSFSMQGVACDLIGDAHEALALSFMWGDPLQDVRRCALEWKRRGHQYRLQASRARIQERAGDEF